MKEFPKTVFVAWEQDKDEQYMLVDDNPADLVAHDDETVMATYELREVRVVKKTTMISAEPYTPPAEEGRT